MVLLPTFVLCPVVDLFLWSIPVTIWKSEFGAPNCRVRALWYYHQFMRDYPELLQGRQLIPISDNNFGRELSAATIFRWICNTIVESYAAFIKSKRLPKTVKAPGVCGVFTSLHLSSKVDLQTVLKASSWLSRGTFTAFYL